MMSKCISIAIAIFSIVTCFQAKAGGSLELLAQDEQWLHLLHYHRAGLFSRYKSQVDTASFFLASNGSQDPHEELKATVKELAAPTVSGEQSVFCRFPARVHWLRRQMPQLNIQKMPCSDFDTWFSEINGAGLTLVFPAAYLNSPSSMYGHTLIRVDRRNGESALLDYAVNFAANTPEGENELLFAYKGLTGGYSGVVSVLPYYEKTNEYSYLESRDIWEYRLDLSQEEVDQFIRHIWELKDVHFNYFFFTENCSYRLLALLDAASSRIDLTDEFYLRAIPADTVRAVVNADLVVSTAYRPSMLSQLRHKRSQLDVAKIDIARTMALAESDEPDALDELDVVYQARVLELAYDYTRYLASSDKEGRVNKRSIELLKQRSGLDVGQVFPEVKAPDYRDDQGHRTRRFGVGTGHDGQRDFLELSVRFAFHDLIDPTSGYLDDAQLEMFNLSLRGFARENGEASEIQVQQLRVIDILSLSPRDTLIKPVSWRVSTGANRLLELEPLAPYLNVGFGQAYKRKRLTMYGFMDLESSVSKHFDKGYRLAGGPAVGLLLQERQWSAHLEFTWLPDISGEQSDVTQAELQTAYHISDRWQLRATGSWFKLEEIEDFSYGLTLQSYF